VTIPLFESRQAPDATLFPTDTVEVRDPRGATISERPVGLASIGSSDMSGDWVWRAYLCNVFIYACTQAIRTDIAGLPFRVGADPDKPSDYDVTHPVAKMLGPPPGGPNPRWSARKLWGWAVTQYLLGGRFAWEKDRNPAGYTVGLWPLVAQHLTAIESNGGGDWFSGFTYNVGGRTVDYQRDQIVYEWRESQDDIRKPESVLAAARLDADVMVLTDRYDAAFLRNDARPAAIVVHQAFADEAEKRAWREQYLSRHQGVGNAGGVMFTEVAGDDGTPVDTKGAVQVIPLGLSQRDAQMAERYTDKIRAICVAFGVPMSRLGDSSKRTYSNAGQEWGNYWESTIKPLCDVLADAINMQLATELGGLVGWFDLSKVQALDRTVKPAASDIGGLIDDQVVTPDEARDMLGLGPTPGGDVMRTPPPPAAPPAPAAAAEPPQEPPTQGRTADPVLDDESMRADEERRMAEERARLEEERRLRIWRENDADVRALEDQFTQRFARLLRRQLKTVIDRLEGKRARQALGVAGPRTETRDAADRLGEATALAAFDSQFWRTETADEFALLFRSVTVLAGEKLAGRLGLAFDVQAPWVADFVDARSNQLAGNVTQTTYDDIRAQLIEGVQLGEGVPELANRIRGLFEQTYASRAETVARTEVISAHNGGSMLAAQNYGPTVVAATEWISTRDSRTRHTHGEADGQVVVLGDTFSVGGASMAYPGDPSGPPKEVVNCRCTIAHLTPQEYAARSERIARIDIADAARLLTEVSLGRRSADDVALELRGAR
jgi:HK97 family phage portal protein